MGFEDDLFSDSGILLSDMCYDTQRQETFILDKHFNTVIVHNEMSTDNNLLFLLHLLYHN